MKGSQVQAITTKYLGPTNCRGARIKAKCQAGSVTVGYEYDSADGDHDLAVLALLSKLGWAGVWIGGGLPDGTGNAYVCSKAGYVHEGKTSGAKASVNGRRA
jgi:hypothetical protein